MLSVNRKGMYNSFQFCCSSLESCVICNTLATLGQYEGQDFRERHEKVKYVPKNTVFQFLETFGVEIFYWALYF